MVKLRKQRRRKRYRAHIDRKRLFKRKRNKGAIINDEIRNAWEESKTPRRNLTDMGLVYDPNSDLRKSNTKQDIISQVSATSEWKTTTEEKLNKMPEKKYVAEKMESDANAPRERRFRMRLRDVEWVTYLMDKYGYDYRTMAKDKRNYQQETWKQIRAKIKSFMSVPEQYAEYLQHKGELDDNKIKMKDFVEASVDCD